MARGPLFADPGEFPPGRAQRGTALGLGRG
jgi:hypothetical protein